VTGSGITPQGKDRLSDLARTRHANGQFDGSTPGPGRPRGSVGKRKRISARVAEAAAEEENAQQIINVFKDAVHSSQPLPIRLKGAEAWARIAQEHARFELQEDTTDNTQRSREELLAILSEKLTSGPAAAIIAKQIEQHNIQDATVVEDE
jgi:hypothetical protein